MAYESKYRREDIDELFDGILTLRDREDCYRFFEDICAINEIEKVTKASTATISRINKCIVYGADGYRRVLDRLNNEEK